MPDTLLAAYEAAPYESVPITGTHVSALETMARLHGIDAAPSDACRALELGCATGGNLIAMAYQLPNSRFVGIDLSPSQIADGHRSIGSLGLTNVELRAMSVVDVDAKLGLFDYIICHGVYSWVPSEIQDAILRVCSANLAPNGVAYVSYNTYPGWHLRMMLRDMLMFHDIPTLPAAERVARARAFMERLVEYGASTPSFHADMIANEVKALRAQTDFHLLHEQLEAFNQPVYFEEFVRRAAAHGLQYLTESRLSSAGRRAPEWVKEATGTDDSDLIRSQQYFDFVGGRIFRSTLLRHAGGPAAQSPSAEMMPNFHFSTSVVRVEPSAEDASKGGNVEAFQTRENLLSTNNPILIAALRSLMRISPDGASFDDLLGRVVDRLSDGAIPGLPGAPSTAAVKRSLSEALLACANAGLVTLDFRPPRMCPRATERPRASNAAKERAARGSTVPNLRHGAVVVTPVERLVLTHLDGARTRDDLVGVLDNAVRAGAIDIGDESPNPAALRSELDIILNRFAATALLEA